MNWEEIGKLQGLEEHRGEAIQLIMDGYSIPIAVATAMKDDLAAYRPLLLAEAAYQAGRELERLLNSPVVGRFVNHHSNVSTHDLTSAVEGIVRGCSVVTALDRYSPGWSLRDAASALIWASRKFANRA